MAATLSRGIKMLQSVNKRYPSTAYLGFSLWLAWQRIMWPAITESSETWNVTPISTSYSLRMHIIANLSLVICIFLFALLEKKIDTLPESPSFLCVGGVAAVIGTSFSLVAIRFDFPILFFDASCALAGIGMAVLLLRCMLIFGALAPWRVLLLTAASWNIAAITKILYTELPPTLSFLFFCALPLASLLLLLFSNLPTKDRCRKSFFNRAESLKPSRSFWRFAFTIFFISLTAQSVVYFNSQHFGILAQQTSSNLVDIVIIAVTAILFLYAVLYPKSYNYNRFYYPATLIVMALLALLFVFPEGAPEPLIISRAAFQIFGLLIWCLLSCISQESKSSPIKVFGFGYGLHMLGSVIGYGLGYHLNLILSSHGSDLLFAYLIVAIFVLAVSIVIYPPQAMKDLLSSIPDEDYRILKSKSSDAWETACNDIASNGNLTPREKEVMIFLARGRGSTYISETLGVSLSTTYTHTRSIYRKLDVHSREDLMKAIDDHLEDMHGIA